MSNDKFRDKNVKECLDFCLELSNDPEFKESISNATHEERVVFLLDNGFNFYLPEEEAKELEKLYRLEVKKQHETIK